jgi:hypothetical protein
VHVPWHELPASGEHTPVEHATAAPQFPFESQVWTPWPEHWVAPGTHDPTQAPFTQAWFTQPTAEP